MAFNDGPHDSELRAAWQKFCAQLAAAGDQVFKDHNPASDIHRVDALRFLTQNLGQAFDLALETRDSRYPMIHPFCSPTRKLGGDAADFTYHQAWIDGQSAYRISGQRGTARFINFTVQGERPALQPGSDIPSLHDPFGDIPEANLFGHQIEVEPDGRFELFIGGPARDKNWLPTTVHSRKVFIRQGFDSWDEESATLTIERLDMDTPRPVVGVETMLEAIDWAGTFVEAVMADWPDHPYQYSPFVDPVRVNMFPPDPAMAGGDSGADDRKRGRAVASLCWALSEDQALIIEFAPPSSFWMLSAMGVFFNSLDYLYRPVSYTPARTRVDADGIVRIVVCHRDPGFHNWIDTQGFERGNLCYRNLLSTETADFATRVVPLSALDASLPLSSKIDAQARREQMKMRFDSIRRRYRI